MKDISFEQELDGLVQTAWEELQQTPAEFMRNTSRLMRTAYIFMFLVGFVWNLMLVSLGVTIGLTWADKLEDFFKFMPYLIVFAALLSATSNNWFKDLGQSKVRIEVTARRCPSLFAELAHLNQTHDIGCLPKVFITDCHNGYAIRIPRFRLFGWYPPVMEIGLSLMLVMSPHQMRGLLAHEWGHFSNPPETLRARLRFVSCHLSASLLWLGKLRLSGFLRPMERYVMKLQANNLALRHYNEYAADRVAAELVGNHLAAQSLVGVYVFGEWIGEYYWKPLMEMTRYLPDPVPSPYTGLYDFCRNYRFDSRDLMPLAKSELRRISRGSESHPALGERLAALEALPEWELPEGPCAAECWLGEHLPAILEDIDRQWVKRYAGGWLRMHHEHRSEPFASANTDVKPLTPRGGNHAEVDEFG
ncbi:MAG: M48 family metalloprotease [Methylococcaceae bacterium]|nr:M48 family metalloprotease [Methylococcaceae bacterium]